MLFLIFFKKEKTKTFCRDTGPHLLEKCKDTRNPTGFLIFPHSLASWAECMLGKQSTTELHPAANSTNDFLSRVNLFDQVNL